YSSSTVFYTLSLHDALPIFFAMARTYLQMGDLENAEQSIRATLERMERAPHRHHTLGTVLLGQGRLDAAMEAFGKADQIAREWRSEEHTSELQSRGHLVCRL